MDAPLFSYQLNESQLDSALAILEKQQKEDEPSLNEKRIFKLFKVATYGIGITALIIFITWVLSQFFSSIAASDIIFFVALLGFLVALPFAVAVTISLLLNFKLVLKLIRQSKLRKSLGLTEVLEKPWKAERRQHRFRNILTVITGLLGVGLIILSLTQAAFLADGLGLFAYLITLAILLVVGVSLAASHFIIRGMERWEVVTRLQSSLSKYKEQAKDEDKLTIDIEPEAYWRVAQIEKAQMYQDRLNSIDAYREEVTDPAYKVYTVQKSDAARQAKKKLPFVIKMHVEDQIDALTEQPYPPDATKASDTGIWWLPVPHTPVRLGYIVDEESDRIKLLFVESDDVAQITLLSEAPQRAESNSLFISYSHHDEHWKDELSKWLEPLEQQGLIKKWDDSEIKAGDTWRNEIEKALAEAKAAILLVSQDFLFSDFISYNELPRLLEKAAGEGLRTFWIPVSTSTITFSHPEISKYQALIDPKKPLDQLEEAERNQAFHQIYEKIKAVVEA